MKSMSIAYLLLKANASPFGGKRISGGVPGIASSFSFESRSGIDDKSAQVYGCFGL